MKLPLVMITATLLGACSSKPDPVLLGPNKDAPYRTWLRTYHDGAYADQPFELFVRSRSARKTASVLSAEQCKNVSVVQTPDTLYVFYESLVLKSLDASEPPYSDQPRLKLCPLQFADCVAAKRRFADTGRKPMKVCTYQTEVR